MKPFKGLPPVLRRLQDGLVPLLGLLLGCVNLGPPVPEGLVPFRPSDNPLGNNTEQYYPVWWADMERCSDRTADLSRVEWFYWPRDSGLYLPIGEHYGGFYDRARNAIWIVERGLTQQTWISHEMLHAILPEPGHGGTVWDTCQVRMDMH